MERLRLILTFCIVAIGTAAVGAQSRGPTFEVRKLADGVYATMRKEPASLWFNPNNGFIIGKRSVIVIDTNISSEYTREVLAALREITDKPVAYVINTHWHEDHIIGNHVYRDAFPNVKFVGQKSTFGDLPTVGASNRKGSIENGQGFIDLLRSQIGKVQNLTGQKLTDEEKAGYESDINLVSSYLAEAPKFQIIMPDVQVDQRLDLDLDGRKVEIIFLGRAHTGADLVVYLPKEKIVFSGDLTVWPVPLIGSTSYPLEYGATLEKLRTINAKTIVPGHGQVMHDNKYIDLMIELLNSIKTQVTAAVARGESLEQVRKSVNLDEIRAKFCGDSQHKSLVFKNYVTIPAIAAAFRELSARTGANSAK